MHDGTLEMAYLAGMLMLLFAGAPRSVRAQTSTHQFLAEADAYFQRDDRLRFIVQNSIALDEDDRSNRGSFTGFVEFALRPLLRLELRHDNDVFRKRYLTARAGYRYVTSLFGGTASAENRAILELNARYPVRGKLVITNRSRGEFRFIHGRPFSARYRNRIGLERDLAIGPIVFTPYARDEFYFDSRYGALSAVRYTAGVLLPVGRHVVAEPYLAYKINKQSATRHNESLGFKLSLFF